MMIGFKVEETEESDLLKHVINTEALPEIDREHCDLELVREAK